MSLVFETIIPKWNGLHLLKAFPLHVRIFMRSSILLANLYAIAAYGLPFGWIDAAKREAVLYKIFYHPNPKIRSVGEMWKTLAFMTNDN